MDLLSEVADVKLFRREAVSDADLVKAINRFQPHQTLFFQIPPSVSKHLLPLKSKNFIWAPMWDGFKKLDLRRRMTFRLFRVRLLCFSCRVFEYARGITPHAMHAQYYLPPVAAAKTCRNAPPYTVFLWQRIPELGMNEVVRVLGRENISKIILKSDIDVAAPSSIEVQRMPEWVSEDEYKAIFDQIDYYVAPRFQEGIGFSFLEAMTRGIPVIGHNDATMNEYIVDGKTSLLFNERFQLPSGLTSPAQLQPALIEHMHHGHRQWLKAVPSVQSFVLGSRHKMSGH
jgi:hypothetical protein